MNEKQRRFADEYIRTGNISESYRLAYQNVTKDSTARVNGSRLLTNANVKAYIDERLELLKKESIAEQDEILQFLSSVVRGEQSEKFPLGLGMGEQRLVKKELDGKDRIKAAELLGKRYAMWTDKTQHEGNIELVFEDDYGEEES